MQIVESIIYFIMAGLCEIGGGYLVWLWLREGANIWFGFFRAIILVLYGVIPTLQPAKFWPGLCSIWWNFHCNGNYLGMADR